MYDLSRKLRGAGALRQGQQTDDALEVIAFKSNRREVPNFVPVRVSLEAAQLGRITRTKRSTDPPWR